MEVVLIQSISIILWKEILSVFNKVEQLILSIFCIIFMKCVLKWVPHWINVLNSRNSGSLMIGCVCSVCVQVL